LRSTIIGQAIYNLYQALGYHAIGENHLGDWGTQFGAIIFQIIEKNLDVKNLKMEDFENLYIEFNKDLENNPELQNEAKKHFKLLEEGDPKTRKIWQEIVNISLINFQEIYKKLGVKIDNNHGESYYEDKMQSVIDEVHQKKLSKKSEGAEIFELPNLPPAMLVKTDGTTTYFTRDLAAIKYRLETWKPKKIIYEVGVEQSLHFNQVFSAAKILGWGNKVELKHIPHGHYRFKGKNVHQKRNCNPS
jgi:arginyl-tRNA synthetase